MNFRELHIQNLQEHKNTKSTEIFCVFCIFVLLVGPRVRLSKLTVSVHLLDNLFQYLTNYAQKVFDSSMRGISPSTKLLPSQKFVWAPPRIFLY